VAAGRDHFIDVASRAHALAQVKRAVRASSPVVLEVGCSSGYFLEQLCAAMPQARIVGADYPLGTSRDSVGRCPTFRFCISI
jgi:tRNA G46 methylase TrmB